MPELISSSNTHDPAQFGSSKSAYSGKTRVGMHTSVLVYIETSDIDLVVMTLSSDY